MQRLCFASVSQKACFSSMLSVMLLLGSPSLGGDFSNPTPFALTAESNIRAALENARISMGSGMTSYYQLGDYDERYQANTNWNNAVLSGNTIILNGDNNVVTLSTDGATIDQTSTDTCQSGSAQMTAGSADATTSAGMDCGGDY